MATGSRIPQIGDYKIVSFFDEFRDDDWYQTSASIKGDLGFAELTATASWFERDIEYQWDNTIYENWRTANAVASYNAGDPDPLYDTAYLGGTIFNDQEQNRWTYEVRLTSQGESRLQWMAGAFYEDVWDWWDYGAKVPDLASTTTWYYAQYLRGLLRGRPGPASPHRYLLPEFVRKDRSAEGGVRRNDVRPDRQLVRHRRSALV